MLVTNFEKRRDLDAVSIDGKARPQSIKLPLDAIVKRIQIRAVCQFSVTYASGTPVADVAGFIGRLTSNIDLVVNGGTTIKSVDANILSRQQMLIQGNPAERAWSSGAAAFTTNEAVTEAAPGAIPFTWPATTEFVNLNETVMMYLENPFIYNTGKMASLLDLRSKADAFLRFNFADISNIMAAQASMPSVTYGAIIGSVTATLIEGSGQDVDAVGKGNLWYFKETFFSSDFSGQTTERRLDVRGNGYLCGLQLFSRNGDVTKAPSDTVITKVQLAVDGLNRGINTTFKALQQDNRSRFGVDAKKTAGVHALKGFAFLNLIKNGDAASALWTGPVPSGQTGVKTCDLVVNSAASSGTDAATYTNPVQLQVQQMEMVPQQ